MYCKPADNAEDFSLHILRHDTYSNRVTHRVWAWFNHKEGYVEMAGPGRWDTGAYYGTINSYEAHRYGWVYVEPFDYNHIVNNIVS